MFHMLAHASLAMQTAFSCLLVCLLEFYYRRVSREIWLRWFAFSWVAQAIYVAALWIAFDDLSGGLAIRLAVALLGFMAPPTFVLTGIALIRGRAPQRTWIAALYLAGMAAGVVTFAAALTYPFDSVQVSRFHNVPRYICYGIASLVAAGAFARHGRQRHLAGSLVTACAWGFYGVINLVRAWQWGMTSTWAPRGAENNPDLLLFALVTFVTNSVVWIVMSIGVGLLLTETAERSERRAKDALRELQAAQAERSRLAQLVEQSRDAILVLSAGQLRYLNGAAASLLGYASDEIPSLFMKPLAEVCGIARQDPMSTQMDGSIAAAGMWEGQSEWRNRLTDERIPVLVGAFSMGTREGDAASTGLIARDLRERTRLEDELRQAQRQEALGRLAGGIAHDFNNLLTVIMGYASLAIEEGLSEHLRQNISEILTASRRAAAITERLRAFGRRQALRAAAFDLNTLVDSMRGTLDKFVDGEVELSYELCATPLPVHADAAQIEQVLMNLVLNARQAIDSQGRIVVRTARANPREAPAGETRDFVKVEVEDSGSGIEPDVLEHIFDPYFTTRSTGTGLGLSMAYGIIRQSQGQIRVSSKPGRGSVFTVILPAGSLVNMADPAPDPPGSARFHGSEALIAIDDRPEVAAFVAACLAHYGYQVSCYTDSESALAALSEGALAQLVIRDVMMPGAPLREFADRLHALRPGLPMVLMSGMPEAAVAPLIEGTGGFFIVKPFAPEQLAALVRRALDAAAILAGPD
ncbi:MAG TPA: ATP-binding protein [Bryobacteraceae bacterium]|nr:ATP-binding protein [Bryobacteraceae bacterium]